MTAMLVTREGATRVRIRDISATGAQVVGVRGISSNCEALLRRHSLFAAARIIWVNGDEGGLGFYRALKPEELDPKLRQTIETPARGDQDRTNLDAGDL